METSVDTETGQVLEHGSSDVVDGQIRGKFKPTSGERAVQRRLKIRTRVNESYRIAKEAAIDDIIIQNASPRAQEELKGLLSVEQLESMFSDMEGVQIVRRRRSVVSVKIRFWQVQFRAAFSHIPIWRTLTELAPSADMLVTEAGNGMTKAYQVAGNID